MCGIAGYAGTRELPQRAIDECLRLMQRRGPDAQAARRWSLPGGRGVTLLSSRLSIIDLNERANQPFAFGTHCIAYNGELYNYLEVAAVLQAQGVALTTSSDTEVVAAALDTLGWNALDSFEGMWALAAHDERDGSLTLSRDRFGEKPLYVHRDETGITFGSEPKLVFALLGRRLPVDRQQVRRYLVNGYKALYKGGHTFFEGLSELAPGSTLRIDRDGREQAASYWQPSFAPDAEMSYDEAVRSVRERLARSVELRLRADVPLAFCLSGGVDSTVLISFARRLLGREVHSFTVTLDDPRYDEQAAVAATVAELGLDHTSVPASTDGFLDGLRELVGYHDAPVFTISYFAHWKLLEAIAGAGYRVSVSGTGADELFSGYYDHHLAYLYEVRGDSALHERSLRNWQREVLPHVRNPHLSDPGLFVADPGFRDHIYLDAERFAGFLTAPFAEPFTEARLADDLLRNRMLNELLHETVPPILHEDDLNAMFFSVENRSPYLDRGLCELAYRIPTRYLVQHGRAKAVLRDAARGIAPDHVLDEPRKVGFNAPILSLLDTADPAVRTTLLEDSPIFSIVRRDRIAELLAKRDLPNSESKLLFYFASAKLFLEAFDG